MPLWQRLLIGVVAGLLGTAVTVAIGGGAAKAGSAPTTVAGVPVGPGEVTVSGRGAFSNLKITVSQTQDLVNQAIGISWTGMEPTGLGQQNDPLTNFLQIMECWGDKVTDASTPADAVNDVPANPGPPREQCEWGGATDVGNYTNAAQGLHHFANGPDDSRGIRGFNGTQTDQQTDSVYESGSGAPEVPFRAVDGTVVPHLTSNGNWLNPYYDHTTTNELPFNFTWPGGTGTAVFQADTALEAPGLGCGDPVSNGSSTPRDCWLVIVPRGPTDINGQPYPANDFSVLGSPLASPIWPDRIAIPLQYRLDASPCPIGAHEHRTQGSELVTAAMVSWQSGFCASKGTVLGYSSLDDDLVRQQLTTAGAGNGELEFLSRAADPSTVPAGEQIVYAPVTLSGVTISFRIDYTTDEQSSVGPPRSLGPPVTQINLTPRLVAKLITDSYVDANAFRLGGDPARAVAFGTPDASHYTWLLKNPVNMFEDPDFQQHNPQVDGLDNLAGARLGATVEVELAGSDAAFELWSWILADPSARAFLAGQPDPWGMTVDPYYSTSAQVNPTHAGIPLPSTSYPSPDPWCGFPGISGPSDVSPGQTAECMTTIRPYTNSMAVTAQDVATNKGLQKLVWDPIGPPPGYISDSGGLPLAGSAAVLGVTSTDQADRYGVVDASLQNAAGTFVAPDTAGLLAGEAAMKPSSVPSVLQPDFTSTSPTAYPLTMLTYAAVAPSTVTSADCQAYASLLSYAAGPGQVPGVALGDLPAGYAPLPAALEKQTSGAAATLTAACAHHTTPGGSPGQGTNPGQGGNPSGAGPTGTSGTPGTAGTPGKAGSSAGTPGGYGPIPSGGPAAIQPLQLTGGITPANPQVWGYGLPVGVAIGLVATMAAPLLSRRRARWLFRALRLAQLPQLSQLPGSPRQL
jgi:hypothetical protein